MRVWSWRAVAHALVLLFVGACTSVAGAQDHTTEVDGTMAAARRVVVDPCALLGREEVEKALSETIGSSRLRADDPLAQAFAVAPSDRVCEYYGVAGTDRGAVADVVAPGSSELASEPRVHEAVGALDAPHASRAAGVPPQVDPQAQVRALALSVSVYPRPLDRDRFDTFHQHRIRQLGSRHGREGDTLAAAVVGRGARFVEEATDRATDVGGIGDAARWYPALAQLQVLVGDVAFAVTSAEQSPMIAGMLSGTMVEPVYDPPPELVELARLAAERLSGERPYSSLAKQRLPGASR